MLWMFVMYWALNALYTLLQIGPSVSVEGVPAVSLSEPNPGSVLVVSTL